MTGPIESAQLALQHLHGARQREGLGPELDGLRHLVPGNPLAGVGGEFLFGDCLFQ